MGNRLTKIYTRTGDTGTSGLANGDRLSKADLIFTVMGDVDELNAHVGMIAAYAQLLLQQDNSTDLTSNDLASSDLANTDVTYTETAQPDLPKKPETKTQQTNISQLLNTISIIQHLLFNIGGELALPEYEGIDAKHIDWLELEIDSINQHLPALKDFILPAGSLLVSQIHITRTVCRRSERQAVRLKMQNEDAISANALKFLNRLSDWLFVAARYSAKIEGSSEVLWNKSILYQI